MLQVTYKVDISPVTNCAGDSYISVQTTATGGDVDRPEFWGFGIPSNNPKLVQRLRNAILSGKVFTNFRILTDVNGKTYFGYDCSVHGRSMNADLKRLGF